MRITVKKFILIAAVLMLCAVLFGCMPGSADELYALPEASDRYVQIQTKVDELLSSGLEYSAPTSGYNRQAIQLQDVDGDGTEEAVAFFRTDASDKKPLVIYILKSDGDDFKVAAMIEGDGTAVDTVAYLDMNGDGVLEIVVGWQMSSSVKNISIYSVKDYQPVQLASGSYSNYTYTDMDSDGDNEVLLLHTGAAENAGDVTMYMLMDDGEMVSYSVFLSESAERTSRIQTGLLSDRRNAVFIDSAVGDGIITDVVAYINGSLVNVTVNDTTKDSDTLRTYSVYCSDINNDGIIEVPSPVALMQQSDTVYYAIRWNTCSGSGRFNTSLTTYHNYSDGWYFILPGDSVENITIRREDRVSGERAVVFSYITGEKDENGDPVLMDILKIYTLTGDNREDRAKLSDRFVISRNDEQIFAAKIINGSIEYASREYIMENFRIIHNTWLTGTV